MRRYHVAMVLTFVVWGLACSVVSNFGVAATASLVVGFLGNMFIRWASRRAEHEYDGPPFVAPPAIYGDADLARLNGLFADAHDLSKSGKRTLQTLTEAAFLSGRLDHAREMDNRFASLFRNDKRVS